MARSFMVVGCLLLVATASAGGITGATAPEGGTPLPPVKFNHWSFELLTNSRYSVHSGFSDSLPAQVMANVLWAMERALDAARYTPEAGGAALYVATPTQLCRYEPVERQLVPVQMGDLRYGSGSGFEVGVAGVSGLVAGMVVQAGLLAGTGFRDLSGGVVGCCPMRWAADFANGTWGVEERVGLVGVFGRAPVRGLDTVCVAVSSDSSLGVPVVAGPDSFEAVVSVLGQDSVFDGGEVSLETAGQLLWAAYGVTPHYSHNGRQGLSVPSLGAVYPLADGVYLVWGRGTARYVNGSGGRGEVESGRGKGLGKADHRLVELSSLDSRADLVAASRRIPSGAGLYVVVCARDTSAAVLAEAGCVAFQLLAQATALHLGGWLATGFDRAEGAAIGRVLGLGPSEKPVFVFACGEPARRMDRDERSLVRIVRAEPAIRRGTMKLSYLLERSGPVRVEVFDMLGRSVRVLADETEAAGFHAVTWDGTDVDGRRLKRGTYLIVITLRGSVAQHKVSLG